MQSQVLEIILKEESGYANHPKDKGGETIFGITRKNYPNLKLWNEVDKLKQQKKLSRRMNDNMLNLAAKFEKEIHLVYKHYFDSTTEIVERYKDEDPNAELFIVAFAVNAGVKRCSVIASNSTSFVDFKQRVIDYYRRIAVGDNAEFKAGWQRRLRIMSGDSTIVL